MAMNPAFSPDDLQYKTLIATKKDSVARAGATIDAAFIPCSNRQWSTGSCGYRQLHRFQHCDNNNIAEPDQKRICDMETAARSGEQQEQELLPVIPKI
eukprot:jgi/Bigna1/135684/aug1.30_g10392